MLKRILLISILSLATMNAHAEKEIDKSEKQCNGVTMPWFKCCIDGKIKMPNAGAACEWKGQHYAPPLMACGDKIIESYECCDNGKVGRANAGGACQAYSEDLEVPVTKPPVGNVQKECDLKDEKGCFTPIGKM